MEKVQGFREADHPLGRVATAVWDGHVFINLAADPRPFAEHLAGLDRKFRPWGMESLKRVERRVYHLKANWKLVIQNYSECLHCPIVHPAPEPPVALHERRQRAAPPHLPRGPDGPPRGHGHLEPGRTDQPAPASRLVPRRLSPRVLLRASSQPPLEPASRLHADVCPVASGRGPHGHRVRVVASIPTRSRSRGSTRRGAIEFWDLTNRQDWELSDLAQAGIGTRGYRPGPYSNREELLLGLDEFVRARVEGGGA